VRDAVRPIGNEPVQQVLKMGSIESETDKIR
jgi:hypothetical protein